MPPEASFQVQPQVSQGLQQSLLVLRQRQLLDAVGAEVGTPVLYLKAAWADPVLYDGRGLRTGGDLDVLVRPHRFEAFAQALKRAGFRRYREPWHMVTHRLVGKAWLFNAPPHALAVDLHRDLVDRPWFHVDIESWIDRARAYPSVDGPILSLAPEDQVLYACAHYASHRYVLGPQHLHDIQRLIAQHPIDWNLVRTRARAANLLVPLALLVDALDAGGCHVEPVPGGWRAMATRACLDLELDLKRGRAFPYAVDAVAIMPLLSSRKSALARYVARGAFVKTLDAAEELFHRVQTRLARHGAD